jgi:hypothetical protein
MWAGLRGTAYGPAEYEHRHRACVKATRNPEKPALSLVQTTLVVLSLCFLVLVYCTAALDFFYLWHLRLQTDTKEAD